MPGQCYFTVIKQILTESKYNTKRLNKIQANKKHEKWTKKNYVTCIKKCNWYDHNICFKKY